MEGQILPGRIRGSFLEGRLLIWTLSHELGFDRLCRLKGEHSRSRLLSLGDVGYVHCLGIPTQNISGSTCDQT